MTLKQHLGNTGCSAKVSVNLERRMCIPQIIQRTVLQQIAKQGISMITIMQTRPLIQLPAHAPTGSPVTTMHQYYFSGFRQFGSGDRRNRCLLYTSKETRKAMLR